MKVIAAVLLLGLMGLVLAAQTPAWGPGRNGGDAQARWLAQNDSGMGMMGRGMGSMQRHRQAMHQGVPEPYASLPEPAAGPEQVAQGRQLYQTHCAACHGEEGRGDGPAAAGLSPAPADLQRLTAMPLGRRPGYLAYAIGEGGVAFGTAMPAYKDTLTLEQRQALVAFLQQGL